jgi:hypothetical protein
MFCFLVVTVIALFLSFFSGLVGKQKAVQIEQQKTEQQKQYNTCLFKLMANGIDIQIIDKQNMCVKPIELKPPVSASLQH